MDENNPYSAPSPDHRRAGDKQRSGGRKRWPTALRLGLALIAGGAAASFMAPREMNLDNPRARGEAFGRGVVQLSAYVAGAGCLLYHFLSRRSDDTDDV